MEGKKYDNDGYLIVSEMDSCPLWEKDSNPCYVGCEHDCFYCAFSNFRREDYMQSIAGKQLSEKLYSICLNENNRNNECKLEGQNEN